MAYEEILTTSTNYAGSTSPGGSAISLLNHNNNEEIKDLKINYNSQTGDIFINCKYLLGYTSDGTIKNFAPTGIKTLMGLNFSTTGSVTQPIYFDEKGTPRECSYTLETSVPSNAKFTDTVTTVETTGNGNAVTSIDASNGVLTVAKDSTFLTTVTKTNVTDALGYTPCRAWTVTIPSGSSGSKVITVTGAKFAQPPLIAKASGSDDDYAKITAVSATTNTLTFTLSAATSAALTLMVIETF